MFVVKLPYKNIVDASYHFQNAVLVSAGAKFCCTLMYVVKLLYKKIVDASNPFSECSASLSRGLILLCYVVLS